MTENNQSTIFENDPDSSSYEHKQSIDQLQDQFSKFGLTNRLDLFSGVVRDVDIEFFFQFHDQFDRVERIGAEVVHE